MTTATPKRFTSTCDALEQLAERAQVEVQVLVSQPELALQFLHARLKSHERLAEPLDLVIGERAALHPANCLAFHELPEQLDQCQDELRQAALDVMGVGVHAGRQAGADALQLPQEIVKPSRAGRGQDLAEDAFA